jgi:hypothetical protein
MQILCALVLLRAATAALARAAAVSRDASCSARISIRQRKLTAFWAALIISALGPVIAFAQSQDWVPAQQTPKTYFFLPDTSYGGAAQCFSDDSSAANYGATLITAANTQACGSYTNLNWLNSWPNTQGP